MSSMLAYKYHQQHLHKLHNVYGISQIYLYFSLPGFGIKAKQIQLKIFSRALRKNYVPADS